MQQTLTIIKPDAVRKQLTGKILSIIESNGFRIVAIKGYQLSESDAQKFYSVHKGKPFFNELVEFMSSGPLVAVLLEKQNAIEDFRGLIGATNPADAAEGTIRRMFAESKTSNAIHGSDSDENAALEANFFFSHKERF
jgi:nucleoside-diphosphate kinase